MSNTKKQKNILQESIEKIKYPNGSTFTCDGLYESKKAFEASPRFNDINTTKVLITLTDGELVLNFT